MIERDEELRKVLNEWQAPETRPALDERVWRSVRQQAAARRRRWMPIAAGIVLAAGGATLWMAHSGDVKTGAGRSGNLRFETRADAAGFQPLPDGPITVSKTGAEQ